MQNWASVKKKYQKKKIRKKRNTQKIIYIRNFFEIYCPEKIWKNLNQMQLIFFAAVCNQTVARAGPHVLLEAPREVAVERGGGDPTGAFIKK